jgi:RNA polymerase sigma-70 factor (ECF subfamily)
MFALFSLDSYMSGSARILRDKSAFEQFYDQTFLQVYRYIYGLHGGPAEDVEDLTADAFIRAWKARKRFYGDRKASYAWILTIARNLVIDDYRKNKRSIQPQQFEDSDRFEPEDKSIIHPEDELVAEENQMIILEILSSLPIDTREMIVLRYILGWSVKQIAEHFDMLENTVTVRIRRALTQIRNAWPV